MNRPVPHIGRTLTHNRALAAYRATRDLPEDIRHELARSERNDELLQPEPACFVDDGVSEDPVVVHITVQNLVLAIGAGVALGLLVSAALGWPA